LEDRILAGALVRRVTAACLACFALLLVVFPALAVASERGTLIRVTRIGASRDVPANSVAAIAVQCPSDAPHPVGADFGALTTAGVSQIVLAASHPTGRHGWSVSVLNLSGQPERFGAAAICVAARTRFAYPRTNLVVGPHQTLGAVEPCPASAPTPLASFLDLRPGSRPGSAVVNWMSQTYVNHRLTGSQSGGMLNLSGTPVRFSVGAVCSGLSISTQQATGSVPAAGANGFTFTCPRGLLAVGGAFFGQRFPDSQALTLSEFFREGSRKWAVAVRNLAKHQVQFTAGDVCAR
jgi:hypothetical protein